MNVISDEVGQELSAAVDTVVRPLMAGVSRKRRIREELLSHLGSLYAEEYQRLDDEQAALFEAKRRFGDPAILLCELRKSLPCWESSRYFFEKLRWEAHETVGHLLGKHLLLSPVWSGLIFLEMFLMRSLSPPYPPLLSWWCLRLVVVRSIAILLLIIGSIMSMTDLGRKVSGREPRSSRGKVISVGLVALLIFPALMALIFGSLMTDFVSKRIAYVMSFCLAPPFAIGLYFAIAKLIVDESRDGEDWGWIEIGE